jgi:addiction module HigA family antidote
MRGKVTHHCRPERLVNMHPGEIIQKDFLEPWGMTPYRLAKGTGMSPTRVSQILRGRRGITAETALRLSRFLGCSPRFWLGLQAAYDLREAEQDHAGELATIQPYRHDGPIILDGEDPPVSGETRAEAESYTAARS